MGLFEDGSDAAVKRLDALLKRERRRTDLIMDSAGGRVRNLTGAQGFSARRQRGPPTVGP